MKPWTLACALAVGLLVGSDVRAGGDSLAPGLSLPRVGTIGDLPPADHRIVAVVDAAGRLRVKGADLTLDTFRAFLTRATTGESPREADGTSRWDLVLAVDAMVPWRAVQWLLQAAAVPPARIRRVTFLVLPEQGDEEGGLATFLPKDRGLVPTPQYVRPASHHLLVTLGEAAETPPIAVHQALKDLRGSAPWRVDLEADGLCPTGYVLRTVDAAFRAGASGVDFVATAEPPAGPDPIGRLVREAAKDTRGPSVRVDGRVPVPSGIALMLPVERVRGGPAGDAGDGLGVAAPKGAGAPRAEEPRAEEPRAEGSDAAKPTIGIGGGAGGAFRERGSPPSGVPHEVLDGVEHALRWLAAHQSPDGGWECGGFDRWCDGKPADESRKPDGLGKMMYDPGVTGLALCAFLGAGYTNRGEHPFAKTVAKGLRYLKNVQDAEGCFGPRTTQHYIYNHAIAALAMVEAYGMTESPLFKKPAQEALDFIALARNPYFAWRYGVKPGDNDTSVTGWMASVLFAARAIDANALRGGRPAPLLIDQEAFDGIRAWIDKMTDKDYGRVGYITPGSGPARPQEVVDRFPTDRSEAMTGVGVFCRYELGPAEDPLRDKGLALISRLPPRWSPDSGDIDLFHWYYGSLAAHRAGGSAWDDWFRALVTAVLPAQHRDGDYCSVKGSWDPLDPWGADGGRVYSTALLAITLETPWRQPPPPSR